MCRGGPKRRNFAWRILWMAPNPIYTAGGKIILFKLFKKSNSNLDYNPFVLGWQLTRPQPDGKCMGGPKKRNLQTKGTW